MNSVKAMRGCIVLEPQGKLIAFATAAFEAYWGENHDISQDAVLADVCETAGVDADACWAPSPTRRSRTVWANTEEVMRRGGFGSPTIFVGGDDMYFGNDRLELVRDAVQRRMATVTA